MEDYIDGRIAAQYFEDDFILFEDFMIFSKNVKPATATDPHAGSTDCLEKFEMLEKFVKRESGRFKQCALVR